MDREDSLFHRILFCTAVRLGSLRQAAQSLGLNPAEVAKGVRQLEREAGGRLLVRSPSGVAPTLLGRRWFQSCAAPLQRLSETMIPGKAASKQIAISMPTTTGATLLFPRIAAFATIHPDVRLDVRLTHGSYHPLWDGSDLRIAHGNYRMEAVSACPLGSVRRIAVATPEYLEKHDPVSCPNDLTRPDVFGARDSVEAGGITLFRGNETVHVDLAPAVISRNHLAALSAALSGAGIALQVPLYLAEEKIRDGKLVWLLPQWEFPPLPLKAFTAEGHVPDIILQLVENLQALFRESPSLIGVPPCGFTPN